MQRKDEKSQRFLDASPMISKNPEFIKYLAEEGENPLSGAKLEKLDIVAIFIALLQTVFFPVLLLMGLLVVLALILRFLAG